MLTPAILKKIAVFLAKNMTPERWQTGKKDYLKQLRINEMELGNELAKALEKDTFGLTDEELVKLSKILNHGPLYYAVAGKVSGPVRRQSFPEIAQKFEDTTSANVAAYPVPIGMVRRVAARNKKRQVKFRSTQK